MANKFARLVKLALACAVPAIASAQTADNYPSRPIRLIVPVPPGGSTDALARIISVRLGESLHQQIVIDNRAGAGGNIAMGVAAKSTPDGHVLLIVSSNFVVNPSLYAQVPYNSDQRLRAGDLHCERAQSARRASVRECKNSQRARGAHKVESRQIQLRFAGRRQCAAPCR